MSKSQWYGTGRRKESTARVFLRPGSGEVVVNHKPLEQYFERETLRMLLLSPLEQTETRGSVDLFITVAGGGKSGQAGAVRMGVARALCEKDPELRTTLKQGGHLRRDARAVERKKYGRPGARKRFQFSKR